MSETPVWTKLFTLAFNGPTFYRHEPSKRVALCAQPEPPMEGDITWIDTNRPLNINITHDREWGYIPVFKPNSEEKAYAYAWVYHVFQLASGLEWPVVAHNRVFSIKLMQPDILTVDAETPVNAVSMADGSAQLMQASESMQEEASAA